MNYMLVMTNLTKEQAKAMVEDQFGSVMWGTEVHETTLTPVIRSYPTGDGVATIMPMDRSERTQHIAQPEEKK